MSDFALALGLGIATFLVVVGVALEGAETIHEIRDKGWKNLSVPKRIEAIGFAMLVIGLAGEWFFSTQIQGRDANRIASLVGKNSELEKALDRQGKKIKAADARLDKIAVESKTAKNNAQAALDNSRDAEGKIADLNGKADALQRKLKDLQNQTRIALLKTEPRRLFDSKTPPPQMVATLRKYAGVSVNIFETETPELNEQFSLAINVDRLLEAAKWKVNGITTVKIMMGGNVNVRYRVGATARIKRAASALAAIMRNEGIDVWPQYGFSGNGMPGRVVLLGDKGAQTLPPNDPRQPGTYGDAAFDSPDIVVEIGPRER